MWVKIVAGVVAALAVVGIGVYVAMPSEGGCGSKCHAPAPQGQCCPAVELSPSEPADTSDNTGCCAKCTAQAVNTDAIAACGGGLTSVTSNKAKTKIACCSE